MFKELSDCRQMVRFVCVKENLCLSQMSFQYSVWTSMDVDDCNGRSYISGAALIYLVTHIYLPSKLGMFFFLMIYLILVLFLAAGSGDSSLEREFSGALGGPTVSTPNSKENSPSRSLSGQWELIASSLVPSIWSFLFSQCDCQIFIF